MSGSVRVMSSEYMQWAKLRSHARFNLATSGVENYPLKELPVKLEDLELSGPSKYGYAPLQEALAAHCGVPRECVVAGIGASGANYLAMAAILEPGDEVVIEHPTYELLTATLGHLQANLRHFTRPAEKGFALDPGEVAKTVTPRTRLIVLANLHNPTSALAEESALKCVGEIARLAGARVLVDEVYLDAAFERAPKSAIHLGPEFVVTSSLTKVYGLSGLRCGWALAEPELAHRMWLLNDLINVIPAHSAELLSCAAVANLDRIRARSRALLEENRKVLNEFLASRNDLDFPPLEFGTVAFPRLLTAPVARFTSLLREKYETTVVPGYFFGVPDRFRIGIGGPTGSLRAGLDRIASALDELRS
jgi:aspartate/methionine/tyrosine aminotransferase